MGAAKPRKFGAVVFWSDDPVVDFSEVRERHDALGAELEREARDLLDRLYKWLDFPPEYSGGWLHDPQPQETKDPFLLSMQDAWIAIRALNESIELAKESNRLRELNERIIRALVSPGHNSAKIKELCEDLGIVRMNRSNPRFATDLYLKLTKGPEGLRIAYELPPGCVDLNQARPRDLPHATPLSNEEAAGLLAEWFEVPYNTVRTWIERERKRRPDPTIKIPLSDDRRQR